MSFGSRAAQQLAKKTVLLTGASSGIGKATAIELAAASNGQIRLILTARRFERLKELQSTLENKYPGIEIFPAQFDISEYKNVPRFIEELPKNYSEIDILVNNAGMVFGKETVGELSISDVETMLFTNVMGLISLTNALIPKFKAKNAGDVVMLGSIAGREAYPGGSIYCASKAALYSFTESLRKETISTGIRVIQVDPGAVETEFSLVRFRGDKEQADAVYKGTTPLTPEDIAEIITFALSRKPNVVLANSLVFPSHQAGPSYIHRN